MKNKLLAQPLFAETLAQLMSASELERRERRIQRLLKLEELISLSQRVDEFGEGHYPPGKQTLLALDPTALGEVLRLVLLNQLRRSSRQVEAPQELKQQLREAREREWQLRTLVVQMAAILSQTYVELGDGAPLSDDAALGLMRELLLNMDEQFIEKQRSRGVALVRAQSGGRS